MKAKKILLMDRHEICNPKIVTTEMFNEAIAELEALQQSRSCEGCKKQDLPSIEQLMACGHCKQLAHDNFEAKEQQ